MRTPEVSASRIVRTTVHYRGFVHQFGWLALNERVQDKMRAGRYIAFQGTVDWRWGAAEPIDSEFQQRGGDERWRRVNERLPRNRPRYSRGKKWKKQTKERTTRMKLRIKDAVPKEEKKQAVCFHWPGCVCRAPLSPLARVARSFPCNQLLPSCRVPNEDRSLRRSAKTGLLFFASEGFLLSFNRMSKSTLLETRSNFC